MTLPLITLTENQRFETNCLVSETLSDFFSNLLVKPSVTSSIES